jgi:phosphotriesterase-related protein
MYYPKEDKISQIPPLSLARLFCSTLVSLCLAFGMSTSAYADSDKPKLTRCEKAEARGKAAFKRGCRSLYTTAGPLQKHQVGKILAHEHMFVEFGVPDAIGNTDASREDVDAVIGPLIVEAKNLGFSVFVDTTPIGVNRRADIVTYIARKRGLPTVLATGFYHEPNVPAWVFDASDEEVSAFMQKELNEGVDDTGVRAGIIKTSPGFGIITDVEDKILRAACDASIATNASIASHILDAPTAIEYIDRLESYGCSAERFVWVHAPYTAFTDINGSDSLMEAAARGAFISLDFMGSNFWAPFLPSGFNDDETQIVLLKELIDAGYGSQILIGQDSGWFDPQYGETGELEGVFDIQGYSHIATVFVEKMREAGISKKQIKRLLHTNPWDIYSR